MAKIIQYWSDVDYCDQCDKPIKRGEDVYVFTESDETDIISTGCSECMQHLEDLIQGYEELGHRMKIYRGFINVFIIAAIWIFPTLRSYFVPMAIWFNGMIIPVHLTDSYTLQMPGRGRAIVLSIYAGCFTLLCFYNVLGSYVLVLTGICFGYALLTWRYHRTPFEVLIGYMVRRRLEKEEKE